MKYESPKDLLQKVWNYPDFLPPQEEIIHSVLNHHNTLALLPTGGGKSLCYQIPALFLEGITLVISPLMALIKDQINALHNKGVKAIYLSSEQSFLGQIDVFDYVRDSGCKIVYVSPERLKNRVFTESLKSLQISLIAVDEAHCISEWGNDFRPSYLHIKQFRENLNNPVTIALTATATPKIQDDIVEKLNLTNTQIFKNSFERKNLNIQFQKTENKIQLIEYLLKKHTKSSLIYVRTRKETENIATQLAQSGFSVDFFHAGLTSELKVQKQNNWMQGSTQTLVCTNAFGMGIDKEDVGLIIHQTLPYSLENYYQEIGRAGRNGAEAFAYLIYNNYDIKSVQSDNKKTYLSASEFEKISKQIFSKLHIANLELPENVFTFHFYNFCKAHKLPKLKVSSCLQFLHNSGVLYWNNSFQKSKIHIVLKPYQIDEYKGIESRILETLARNVSGVFNDFVTFDEKYWARFFQLPIEDLRTYLLKWQKNNFINYSDGSAHSIQMILPRDDGYIFKRLGRNLQNHQHHKKDKLNILIQLISQKTICRTRYILDYFGEKNIKDCQKCDVCLRNIQQNDHSLSQKIFTFIGQNKRSISDILLEFTPHSTQDILDALQHLISEDKLKNLTYNTYTIKN